MCSTYLRCANSCTMATASTIAAADECAGPGTCKDAIEIRERSQNGWKHIIGTACLERLM